jgi:ATPase subunit of ABC transporter with duplicated ATPase domains
MALGVNVLVLDEPTNHSDLAAIEELESAFESFGGTAVVVSHDRRLLDRLAATRSGSGRARDRAGCVPIIERWAMPPPRPLVTAPWS